MINLLIVDDEQFTREGIIEMLPLKSLNISNIKQAFDGIDALEKVKDFKPDILLTDVKMPRMDGMELALEIRKQYPECSIIFMSGYSDKEYLKCAIKLKAISYVEKPIELDELETAIKNAVLENSKSKTIHNNIEDTLALDMIDPNNTSKIEHVLSSCVSTDLYDFILNSNFLTSIITLEDSIVSNSIINDIKSTCSIYNINCFISKKDDNILIIQFYFKKNTITSNNTFNSIFTSIAEKLKCYSNYYISIGNEVTSIDKVHTSYIDAINSMKCKFFYDYNSIIYSKSQDKNIYTIDDNLFSTFSNYLDKKDKQNLLLIVKKLTSEFRQNKSTSISYIRNVYYNLILLSINHAEKFNIHFEKTSNTNSILDLILGAANIFSLETLIIDFVNELFQKLDENNRKTEPIHAILNHIHNNYSNSDLCLEEISRHTFLTPAYICVIFKQNTSSTVNKYITEYRIEKAKTFLKDSNIKMSSVAEKVGYSDANYFSKIFRKSTSYTPSEYRRNFSK